MSSLDYPESSRELVRQFLKELVEKEKILQSMPKDLAALFGTDEANPQDATSRPPSAL